MNYLRSVFHPKLLVTMKGYTRQQFGKDVTAGIIVAIIALPLSIALAIASGVSPEKGIYTAIIAGFLISLLGGSRVQIGGPTAAFMVIVYGIVAQFGVDGLMIATFMAGIMMVLFGFAKMGSVIKFIPYTITTGFTSGIAVTILTSQVKDFLGLTTADLPADFLGKWKVYISSITTVQLEVVGIGALALLIMIFWPKVTHKVPGAFVALIVTSVLVYVFHIDVPTIGSKFGALSSALPTFTMPQLSTDKVLALIEPAFTIAFLGSVESLLSAVVSDGMIGSKHRSNTELIAQGIANMGSAVFGGIPATGAIARTVANIKNGGRTPVAGMVHSVTLLLILVLFMPFAKMIPLASLAAVLIIVAYNMSSWREFADLLKSPKSDILVLLVTFFMTVFFDLVKAIEIGIVLAALLFMKRMADVAQVKVRNMDASEDFEDGDEGATESVSSTDGKSSSDGKSSAGVAGDDSELPRTKVFKDVLIYEINGPFFFGAADKFLDASTEVGKKTKVLIIKLKHVPAMDATALHAFSRMIKICKKRKITFLLTGIQEQPRQVLEKAGLIQVIGEDHIFAGLGDAINYVQENPNIAIKAEPVSPVKKEK